MPPYKGPQALGEVLSGVIRELGIQQKLDEVKIVETWAAIAGHKINGITETAWVKGDTLFVKITSSAWRQELHMQRGNWCRRLNEQLGKPLVREIVFR